MMGPEDNPADDVQPTKEEYEAWEADAESQNDGQSAQCCQCDQPSVGYSEGEPYCAAHYRSRPAFFDKPKGGA